MYIDSHWFKKISKMKPKILSIFSFMVCVKYSHGYDEMFKNILGETILAKMLGFIATKWNIQCFLCILPKS